MIPHLLSLGLMLLLASPPKAPLTVGAAGVGEAKIEIQDFGRYAISAKSPRGTAIRLLDRMTGQGPLMGKAGERDGRVDVFLERGDYKILTQGPTDAEGQATLRVDRFIERGDGHALVEGRRIDTQLGDLEVLSYWLELPRAKQIVLEAAGRNLATLRVWRDGAWLNPTEPQCASTAPTPERPLNRCRFVAQLPAGLHKISLYGGPSQPWAVESHERPLHLRYGIPRLDVTGYSQRVISPFGEDLFIAPAGADRFDLWLGEYAPGGASSAAWQAAYAPIGLKVERVWNQPFGDPSRAYSMLSKKARVPQISEYESSGAERLISVTGAPGQGYALWHYEEIYTQGSLRGDGDYLLSLIPTTALGEVITPTGFIWRQEGERSELVAERFLELGPNQAYQADFNVDGQASLLLKVTAQGSYPFYVEGARFQVQPLVEDEDMPFEAAPFAHKRLEVLSPGLYTLTLKSDAPQVAKLRVGLGALRPSVGIIQVDKLTLKGGEPLYFRLGETGARMAKHQYKLPLTLEEGAPLGLQPKQKISLRVAPRVSGALRAPSGAGALRLSVDRGPWAEEVKVPAGEHVLHVESALDAFALARLEFTPDADPLKAPQAKPKPLDRVLVDEPLAFAVKANTPYTRKVEINFPGFYIVESDGLLSVRGRLRTRTRPSLATNTGGGPGGNTWLSAFLRPGDYAVTYTPQGRSEGALRARVRPAKLVEAGALVDGRPGRVEIPADTVARFTFEITEAGRHGVEAFGLDRTLRCRLEDAEGWPIGAVNGACDRIVDLKPGRYALLLPAQRVEITAQALLRRVAGAQAVKGHGPHAVALNSSTDALWRESPQRVPDVWTFKVPAKGEITLSLGDAMIGRLLDAQGAPIGRVLPGRRFKQTLEAGAYRLEAQARRRDDLRAYTLELRSAALMEGQSRDVSLLKSETLDVAVGEAGRYVISSFGRVDAMARLISVESGLVIAQNDDRPTDWNFHLAAQLTPGRYRLVIDNFEEREEWAWRWEDPKDLRVEMRRAADIRGPGLSAATATRTMIPATADSLLMPLKGLRRGPFALSVESEEALEVLVEAKGPNGWREIAARSGASVQLTALAARWGDAHRLRVSSLDLRGLEATLSWRALEVPAADEAALAAGIGAAGARVEAPTGLFRLSRVAGVTLCGVDGARACEPARAPLVYHDVETYIFGEGVKAERVTLSALSPVKISAPEARAFNLAPHVGRAQILTARVSSGAPQLGFGPDPRGGHPAARSANGLLAIDPTGVATHAALWPTDRAPAVAELKLAHLAPAPAVEAGFGARDLVVPASSWIALKTPAEAVDYELSLARGLAALVEVPHWADEAALHLRGATRGGEIYGLYNPTSAPLPASLALRPAAVADDRFAPHNRVPLQQHLHSAGRYVLAVPPVKAGQVLYVRGGQLTASRARGAFESDAALLVREGDVFLIDHGPGPLMAWFEQGDPAGPCPALEGEAQVIDGARRVHFQGGAKLRLAFQTPGLLRVRGRGAWAVSAHAEGAERGVRLVDDVFEEWLPTGKADLEICGLFGDPIGAVEIDLVPATPLAEGINAEALLMPGERRAYTLDLEAPRTIGFGLRASADRVTLEVRHADGATTPEGLAQMTALEAGRHTLLLRLPADSAPTRVKPVVVGITPPTGITPELIEDYKRKHNAQGGE